MEEQTKLTPSSRPRILGLKDLITSSEAIYGMTAGAMEQLPPERDPGAPEPNPITGRKFSSTQLDFPFDWATEIRQYGIELIPDEDIYEPEGREDRPHITVKYGIHSNFPDDVEKALEGVGPVTVTIGQTMIFEAPDFDVVNLAIISTDLMQLNKIVADSTEVTDTFPTYVPHAALAYVKKGRGKKYDGLDNPFTGQEIEFDKVTFCSRNGDETIIPLSEVIHEDKGGTGSGNFGHSGRPGLIGGSGSAVASKPVTETAAFKKWFGDSKVVDANGKPAVVYHGTTADFLAFDPSIGATRTHAGRIWFAQQPEYTDFYSGGASHSLVTGAQVLPLYVSAQNPRVFENGDKGRLDWAYSESDAELQKQGYDGVIFKDAEFGHDKGLTGYVFKPTQVKSATGNSGAFDPTDPNITKGGVGSGNYGHAGRPGEIGGSAPGGGVGKVLATQVRKQGGFTYNPLKHGSPKHGYVVALPREHGMERVYSTNTFKGAHAKEILKKFVTEVRDGIKHGDFKRNAHVGAWLDTKGNRVVLDVSEVYNNEQQAIKIGKQREQDAIYQIGVGEIDLGRRKSWDDGGVDRGGNGRRSGSDSGGDDDRAESVKGGAGSGNYGHSGRPGLIGGSMAVSLGVASAITRVIANTVDQTPLPGEGDIEFTIPAKYSDLKTPSDAEIAAIAKNQEAVIGNLPKEQTDALKTYAQDVPSTEINGAFRHGETLPTEKLQTVAALDSAINKTSTDRNLQLYRGLKLREGYANQRNLDNFAPGTVIQDKGFVSASLDKEIAAEFSDRSSAIMVMDVPKGSKAFAMYDGFGPKRESEMLLPRNLSFKVEGVKKYPGQGYNRGELTVVFTKLI